MVRRFSIALSQARLDLNHRPPLRRQLAALGVTGGAQDLLLAAHLRGEPVALADLIVSSAVPRNVAGPCIRQLVERGHLWIADGSMAVTPETAAALDHILREPPPADDPDR